SGAGIVGSAGVAIYAGAKAFTHVFAEGLWAELGPQGVDVIAVPMGRVATPANMRTNINDLGDPLTFPADPAEMARQCLEKIKQGPIVYPEHVAETYTRLTGLPRREAVEWMRAFMQRIKAKA